jgi:hypothetical protein
MYMILIAIAVRAVQVAVSGQANAEWKHALTPS